MQSHFWFFSFDSMANNDSAQIHLEDLVERTLSECQKGTGMDPFLLSINVNQITLAFAPAILVLNRKFFRSIFSDMIACSQVLLERSRAPYCNNMSITFFHCQHI